MLLEVSIALSCILASAMSQGTIDMEDCIQVPGLHGEEVVCPTGMVATGACSSGIDLDCYGFSHILRCCGVITADDRSLACTTSAGLNGEEYECPVDQQVMSLCASGQGSDCGYQTGARSRCCDGNGITTNENSLCNWSGDSQGRWVFCGPAEVMVGFCGSGSGPDCDDMYTKVKCCSYF